MARTITIHRPITLSSLAVAIGVKNFELMAELIRLGHFPSPRTVLEDPLALTLAARKDVDLHIISGDGGEETRYIG